jgi:hypothetical protein
MNKGQAKIDQMEMSEQHKAVDNSKQQELVALKAKVETLTKAVNKFKKKVNNYDKSDKPFDSSSNTGNNNNDAKRKRKGKKGNGKESKPFPEILNSTPALLDPSVPTIIDGEKHWWWVVLGKWYKHSPEQCKAKDRKQATPAPVRATSRIAEVHQSSHHGSH